MIYNKHSFFFDITSILNNNITRKYYYLFKTLDKIIQHTPIYRYSSTGRKPYSRLPFIRAFIIKTLENFTYVSQLITFLQNNPTIAYLCGFDDPFNLPHSSQFYRFLMNTNPDTIQHICSNAVKILQQNNCIDTSIISIDSKPILAYTKHNNFKNPNRITSNAKNPFKDKSRNYEATLGYYSAGANSSDDNDNKNIIFVWGYRIHIITDKNGIPIAFAIFKNNVKDHIAIIEFTEHFHLHDLDFNTFFVLGDKAFDNSSFHNFVSTQFQAAAIVPLRKNTNQEKYYSTICPAGYQMKFDGKVKEKYRTRLKFRCPIITANKNEAKNLPASCPCGHPKFYRGKKYGCIKYIDTKAQNRLSIDRNSPFFKSTFKHRKAVERAFANSHFLGIENPTHFYFSSIKNFAAINILSQLLVAVTAACVFNNKSKMRAYKTFTANAPPPDKINFEFAA